MAFVDIGSNAGLFSMVAGQRVGTDGAVLAFEPNPLIFSDLVRNIELNGLSNVRAFNAAVGERSGKAFFAPGDPKHTGAGHLTEDGLEVDMVSFEDDHTFSDIVGKHRVVVKIDVEGAEGQVIAGRRSFLAKPQVEKVIAEIDDENLRGFGSSAIEVYTAMELAGFKGNRGIEAAKHFNEIFIRH